MMGDNGSDRAVRFLFEDCAVRGVWVQLQQSVAEIFSRTASGLPARRLLGESVAAAVMLSRTIKLQGRLAIQARGDGALRLLVAESTQDAGVRGIIDMEPVAQAGQPMTLQQCIGTGYLAVTLLPDNGESYQGIVPLQQPRLQDCLADYFVQSEQLPTALWLFSDGERAAGLMLQALPAGTRDNDNADENGSDDDGWQRLCMLAGTVTADEMLSLPCETLLHRLFHDENVLLFDPEPVHFQCTCSAERSRQALAVIGRDELLKLFAEQPEIAMDCQFCASQYRYTAADMADVLGAPPTQLH